MLTHILNIVAGDGQAVQKGRAWFQLCNPGGCFREAAAAANSITALSIPERIFHIFFIVDFLSVSVCAFCFYFIRNREN